MEDGRLQYLAGEDQAIAPIRVAISSRTYRDERDRKEFARRTA